MAVKEKLTEQVKQLSACVTELYGEEMKGMENIAVLKVKLKAAERCAEDITYGKDGLHACLKQFHRGHDIMG